VLQDKRLQQQQQQQQQLQSVHHIFELLPTLTCWSPTDSLDIMAGRSRGLTSSDSVISLHRCDGDIRVMCNDVAMVVLTKAMYAVKKVK